MYSGANNTSTAQGSLSGFATGLFGTVAPSSSPIFVTNSPGFGFHSAQVSTPGFANATSNSSTSSFSFTNTGFFPPTNTPLPSVSATTQTSSPSPWSPLTCPGTASSTNQTASGSIFTLPPPSSTSNWSNVQFPTAKSHWSNVQFPPVQTTSTAVSTTTAALMQEPSNMNKSSTPASASSAAAALIPITELPNGFFIAPMTAAASASTSSLPLSGVFIARMPVTQSNSQTTPAPSATKLSLSPPSVNTPTEVSEFDGGGLIDSISAMPMHAGKSHEELRWSFYQTHGGNLSGFVPVKAVKTEPRTEVPLPGPGKTITIGIEGLNISVQI